MSMAACAPAHAFGEEMPRKTLFERMSDIARDGGAKRTLIAGLKDAAYRSMPDPAESARFASMLDQLSGERLRLDPLPMPRKQGSLPLERKPADDASQD